MADSLFYSLIIGLCSNFSPHMGTNKNFTCLLRNDVLKTNVLKGKTVKIVTYDDPPLSFVVESENGTIKGGGVAFEIIHYLQKRFGFQYEVIKTDTKSIGNENSGALGLLTSKKADMVAAFVPTYITANDFIKWGRDFAQNVYYILMTRPKDSAKGSGLLAPFDTEVWILIICSVFTIGPVLYGFAKLAAQFHSSDQLPLKSCFWFAYGALVRQGSSFGPQTDSLRIILASWWIFITVITAFYTANLTAFLTISLFTLEIQSIEDVATHSRKWFAAAGGGIEFTLQSQEDQRMEVLSKSYRSGKGQFLEITSEKALEMVSNGWLYLDDERTLTRLVFNDYLQKTSIGIEESKRCTYVLTQKQFMVKRLAFAYAYDSILPDLFNPVMQILVESGIIDYLISKDQPITPICPIKLGSKERKLTNGDLLTTYYLILIGYTSAFTTLCFEFIIRLQIRKKKGIFVKIHDRNKTLSPAKNDDKALNFKNARFEGNRDFIFLITKSGGNEVNKYPTNFYI